MDTSKYWTIFFACVHLLVSIYLLFHQDTCISVAQVSNTLRFDTFFTFILSFEDGISMELLHGISNEWTSLP